MRTVVNPATGELITVLARLKEHTDIPNYPTVAGTYSLEYTQASDSFAWASSGGGSDGNGILDAGNNGGAIAVSTLSLAGSLNIDSNTFFINGANGRVGIGIATPTATLHIRFPSNLASASGLNIQNTVAAIMQIKNNGNMGLGIQASTGASGSDWMRIKPMNDHLVGINYEYFSQTASTGAKIALNMKVDNGTTNSPFGYINILDSRDNGTFNKSGLSIDITDGGGTGQMKALQIINGVSLFSDDLEFDNTAKGIIYEDRTLSTRHRVYLDNGVLSIEAA